MCKSYFKLPDRTSIIYACKAKGGGKEIASNLHTGIDRISALVSSSRLSFLDSYGIKPNNSRKYNPSYTHFLRGEHHDRVCLEG